MSGEEDISLKAKWGDFGRFAKGRTFKIVKLSVGKTIVERTFVNTCKHSALGFLLQCLCVLASAEDKHQHWHTRVCK